MTKSFEERQLEIMSENLSLIDSSGDCDYHCSKLNDVINLYRNTLPTHFTADINDKLITPSERIKKEIYEDMLDWETYMYCKENEERQKISNDCCYPIRNEERSNIIITAHSKNYRNKLRSNVFIGNSYSAKSRWIDENYQLNEDRNRQALEEKVLGNSSFEKGLYEEACQHYTESLKYFPLKDVYNNRAMSYIRMKNFSAALNDINEVLKIDPTNEKALYRKAKCRKEMRMYEEALRDLRIYVSQSKTLSNLYKIIQEEKSKLNGKKYNIRSFDARSTTFAIDISQLSAYASCDETYLLEVDRTGCSRSCVCGYCTADDLRNKTRSSGLRIKDRHRWKILTNNLLDEMHIAPSVAYDGSSNENKIQGKSVVNVTQNGNICQEILNNRSEKFSKLSISSKLSKTNTADCVHSSHGKNTNIHGIINHIDENTTNDLRLQLDKTSASNLDSRKYLS